MLVPELELVVCCVNLKTGEMKLFRRTDDRIYPTAEIDKNPMVVAKELFESIFNTTAEWPRFNFIGCDFTNRLIVTISVMIPEDIKVSDGYPGEWVALSKLKENEVANVRKSLRFN